MAPKPTFNFDDLFPERWLHADDLGGKQVTVTIAAAYQEDLRLPGGAVETCGILSFVGAKKEYVLNKTNATVLRELWGKNSGDYTGHRITLAPVPDSSGKSASGFRILFVGSPDIDKPLTIRLPGGGKHVVQVTRNKEPMSDDSPPTEPAPEPEPEPEPEPADESDMSTPFDDLPSDDAPGVGSEDGDAAIARQIETMANEPRITRGMLTRLGALGSQLTAAGIPEDQWRAEIFTATSGRTTSRKELTEVEAKVLTVNLSGMLEDARAAKVGVA